MIILKCFLEIPFFFVGKMRIVILNSNTVNRSSQIVGFWSFPVIAFSLRIILCCFSLLKVFKMLT